MNKKTDLTITSWNVDEFNRCPKQFWVSANNPSDLPGIQASALRAIEAAVFLDWKRPFTVRVVDCEC